jgi:hypothetical protein
MIILANSMWQLKTTKNTHMKKLIVVLLLANSIFAFAQEKKINFTKELDYQFMSNKRTENNSTKIKIYAGSNGTFLSKISVSGFSLYFYTDALGTSSVSLEMGNRLESNNLRSLFGFGDYYKDDEEVTFKIKNLGTKETILGVSCTQYLLKFDGEENGLKISVDEKYPYNNFAILKGFLQQFSKKSMENKENFKGLIMKVAPENSNENDNEYVIVTSIKDFKDFVFFDHEKAISDQQRIQDSMRIAYQEEKEKYEAYQDSLSAEAPYYPEDAIDSIQIGNDDYDEEDDYYFPYVSEYKNEKSDNGGLAIHIISNKRLWTILPNHCQTFEKDVPDFDNKELKKHLKNYVGQMCDMYLSQQRDNFVAIKETLDQIRREVLYFNNIQKKLSESDKKKLNDYLNSLD